MRGLGASYSFFEVFGFVSVVSGLFDPKADMYIANVNQRVIDMLFSVFSMISDLVLCLSLLKVAKAVLKFTLTLDNCLVYCKCSSKRTPRYLTVWAGIRCFPCGCLNLEGSS